MEKVYKLDSGKEINVKATRQRISERLLDGRHYAYSMVFSINGERASFTFHDSIYHYMNNIGATEEMIDNAVQCITEDAIAYEQNNGVREFMEEFGYDVEDYHKAERTYEACGKTYNKLLKLMSINEIYELCNEIIIMMNN